LANSRTQNEIGLSTRAGMALGQAARAWAFICGRDYTTVDDIKKVFISVAAHRLGGISGLRSGLDRAQKILHTTQVPRFHDEA
jgi:MoxR-like ATPase